MKPLPTTLLTRKWTVTMRNRLASFALLPVLLLAAAASAQAADLRASLSSQEAYVGAPITLYVEVANASDHSEPTLPDVPGVDIRQNGAPRQSSQTTIVNGRRTDRTSATYAYHVIPRHEGTFEIPSIEVKVDGKVRSTRPLRFVATKSETGDLFFVEVSGQADKIYVGQPLKMTLNLWVKPYHDEERDLTLSEGDMWNMISSSTQWGPFSERMTELDESNQRPGGVEVLRKDSNGDERAYYQYQIEATIYPKRPGQIDMDDMQVVVDYPTRLGETRDPFGSMFDDDFFRDRFPFGGRGFPSFNRRALTVAASRPVVAAATVSPIDVEPIPTAGRPADYRGAVGKYKIVTQASPTSVKAGDPITLHIGVRGTGPMDLVQAPPLALLPQLTKNFKVSGDPLAGIVEGDTKVFTTSIRPRKAGIKEIPPIPMSYFDPETESFQTVESAPIPIEVTEAERLALDSIIGQSGADRAEDTAESSKPELNLVNYTGNDAITNTPASPYWPWALAAVLPPLLFASFWGVRHRQENGAATSDSHTFHKRTAHQAISQATSPSEIANTLRQFASACGFSAPQGGAVTSLRAAGFESIAEQLETVLDQCEQAAYGGMDASSCDSLRPQANRVVEELSKVASYRSGSSSASMMSRKKVFATACLATALVAVIIPTAMFFMQQRPEQQETVVLPKETIAQANLPKLTSEQQQTLLTEANDAYEKGMANSDDAATAKEEFATAISKYQLLVDSGVRNANTYVNLANAQLQQGLMGKAIANYERALALDDWNSQARQNLAVAQAALPASEASPAASVNWVQHAIHTVRTHLSVTTTLIVIAVVWIAFWLAMLSWVVVPSQHWQLMLVPLAAVLLMGITFVALEQFQSNKVPQAIVVSKRAVLHEAPGAIFPAVSSEQLTEGESLGVIGARGDWLQVQTPSGTKGWIEMPEVELLST